MNYINIEALDDERIELYTKYSENQLFHANEPELGYFVCESPEVIKRALDAGYEVVSFLVERENITEAVETVMNRCEVPVYVCAHEVIKDLAGYGLTRGMLCLMRRRDLPKVHEVIEGARNIAVLEDVMNPTNVGAIMRSAAALNIDAVLLTEGCSDPLYRRAARVSMGTVFQVPWTFINKRTLSSLEQNECDEKIETATKIKVDKEERLEQIWPSTGLKLISEAGFNTISMALKENTIDIRDKRIGSALKKCIILGTEGTGLKDETIDMCDYTVKIPMSHGVDSLNVAAASAVAFWEMTR